MLFWVEIFGAVILYLLIGIPAIRLMYIVAEDKSDVEDMSGVILLVWPIALVFFGIIAISKLAFKWGPK